MFLKNNSPWMYFFLGTIVGVSGAKLLSQSQNKQYYQYPYPYQNYYPTYQLGNYIYPYNNGFYHY